MRYLRVGFLAAFLLLASACADSTPTEGPVTIETQTDLTVRPIVGTFEVTESADILGCSSGTFVDEFETSVNINRVMTCDAGSNDGTFTAVFALEGGDSGPGDENGPWSVAEASGDFVGLQGAGEFSAFWDSEDDAGQGVETWTGDIEYTP